MSERAALYLLALFGLLLFLSGVAVGWKLRGSDIAEITEPPATPIVHDDGSITLQRDAEAKPTLPVGQVPGTTVRTIEVVLKPDPVEVPATADCPAHQVECPPVTVRLDLSRLDDQTHRVTAIADGGEVVGGIDIPVGPTIIRKEHPWMAGAQWLDGGYGLFVGRSYGRLQVVGSLGIIEGTAVPSVGIGWRF